MAADLDSTLAALADPVRRGAVELLADAPRCSSALADALNQSRPAMSRHLGVLRRAGLVEEDHSGEDARVRVYQLRRDRFALLRDWVGEIEAFWTDQLAAFKRHAEGKKRR